MGNTQVDRKVFRNLVMVIVILCLISKILKMLMPLMFLGAAVAVIAFCVLRINKKRNEFYLNNDISSGVSLQNRNSIMFSNSNIVATQLSSRYDIMFANGVIDLTKIPAPAEKSVIEVNASFGSGLVKINPNIPTLVRTSCAFGKANLPNGTSINFGDYTYKTRSFNENEPYVIIKADASFGSLEIVEGL